MEGNISYKNILGIALPIIISGVAQNVINVTDTMLLGRLDKVALGAGGNAGIFYFILVITGMGFTTGAQIIMGRRNGEKNFSQIGKVFDHCIYFIIPLGILLFAFMKFWSPSLLGIITKSDNILNASVDYLSYRSFGIIFAFINFTFLAFYIGTTKTRVLIFTTLILMIVNVFLDYVLIFGYLGFPAMGIKGAALASVIAEVAALIFFIVYTYLKIDLNKFQLFRFKKYNPTIFKRILKVGSPIMLQNFLSLSSWFIFFMIIEKLGEDDLAISHIIRSIYMVMMIPLFGFSSSTNTFVSNLIGQGNSQHVMLLLKKVIVLSIASTFIMFIAAKIFPSEIIGFYTNDNSLITDSLSTLNIISYTMFFFSIAFILFNGVSGTGNTKISLLIEFITITIYLVVTYYIAIVFKLSLPWVWSTEFVYFGLLGSLSFFYLKWGNWKNVEI